MVVGWSGSQRRCRRRIGSAQRRYGRGRWIGQWLRRRAADGGRDGPWAEGHRLPPSAGRALVSESSPSILARTHRTDGTPGLV